jgi:hypothetical protein
VKAKLREAELKIQSQAADLTTMKESYANMSTRLAGMANY